MIREKVHKAISLELEKAYALPGAPSINAQESADLLFQFLEYQPEENRLKQFSKEISDAFGQHDYEDLAKGINRKLAGRILGAISKLIQNPTEAKGNMLKPLTGSMSGLWRFRIGDYRLIYQPIIASKQIFVLNFGGRGSVYPPKGW